jgi:hypothetical protein
MRHSVIIAGIVVVIVVGASGIAVYELTAPTYGATKQAITSTTASASTITITAPSDLTATYQGSSTPSFTTTSQQRVSDNNLHDSYVFGHGGNNHGDSVQHH